VGQVGAINLDGVIGGAQAALKIATGPVTITSADDVGLHDNALFSLASGNLTNSGHVISTGKSSGVKAATHSGVHLNGSSSLMVAGALTNNTALNLGHSDHSLAANTTVTAAGLANTGTVNLFGNTGSPAI
jgi:hypothetical protein